MVGIWYKHSMNEQGVNGVQDRHVKTKKAIYTFEGCFSLLGVDVFTPIPFGPCSYQILRGQSMACLHRPLSTQTNHSPKTKKHMYVSTRLQLCAIFYYYKCTHPYLFILIYIIANGFYSRFYFAFY